MMMTTWRILWIPGGITTGAVWGGVRMPRGVSAALLAAHPHATTATTTIAASHSTLRIA